MTPRSGPVLALGLVALACNLDPGKEAWVPESEPARKATPAPREPCAHRDPLRLPLYGDLHLHTGFSMDAWVTGTIATPDDAYRFARGHDLGLPPFDDAGRPAATTRIDRPLDFAAVTDHAEWLGEVRLCRDPESPVYATNSCRIFRGEAESTLARLLGLKGFRKRLVGAISLFGRNEEICGDDSARCRAETRTAWQANHAATERWYDRSSECRFTTLHGYEYSRSPSFTKIHRNVIFRNEIVPELPISWIDTPTEPEFWSKLRSQCVDTDSGCDAVAIPHNPNLSNGQLFAVWYRDLPVEEQRAQARLRAGLEPIVEMVQIKGESECRNGLYGVVGGPDELCEFEKIRDLPGRPLEDCEEGTGSGAQRGQGCVSRLDYVRYALVEGLREAERIGVNPYAFGFIGSTDTHLGNPGGTDERTFVGKFAASAVDQLTLGERRRPEAFRSAGGLAGVWAEENSREAIFDALARREAFATSGTRIAPRLFAGWDLPENLCERDDRVTRGYAAGVPMGGTLPPPPRADATLRFLAEARRDPRGAPLERIQVVKAWVGDDGSFHQAVHDVARVPPGASVDLDTCALRGAGAETLCTTWSDPDFDPERAAVYYARVIENPSCRWTTWRCLSLPAEQRPDGCSDPRVPRTIQERAWTSPIWLTPLAAR
ncbi:MAG: DUF3604 domain-containing protein [Myxococcota bacterium]|nr:DUF3604 domain-containing protein [Myxococcota bacterium]